MLATIRFILIFLKKEESIAHKYSREHPRFKWLILLDAIITSLLIFGGVSYASQSSSLLRSMHLFNSGAKVISLADMTDHMKVAHTSAYWMGPISGVKYTYVDNSDSRITITYWPLNSNTDVVTERKFTVETFSDMAVYSRNLHPLEDPNSTKIVAPNGMTVQFNQASLDHEIVTFRDHPEVVVIDYPVWQLETVLMNNAEALKPVS
jgi:hypothetical protein